MHCDRVVRYISEVRDVLLPSITHHMYSNILNMQTII